MDRARDVPPVGASSRCADPTHDPPFAHPSVAPDHRLMGTIEADRVLRPPLAPPPRRRRERERARRRVRRNRRVVAGAFGLVLLAVTLLLFTRPAAHGGAPPLPVVTGPNVGPSAIDEGPAGRVALRRWVLHLDPHDAGLGEGLQSGDFAGRTVAVPNVVNAWPVSGPGVDANYNGSVAWYRTSFDVPSAGLYALHFESVNFLATVWVDGRRLGTHAGEYLPFEYRVRLGPGAHAVVVRVDWRNPAAQSAAGFHRTWFNFGGINREVSVRPIGPSELGSPNLQTTLRQSAGGQRVADITLGVQVRNDSQARVIAPRATLSHGGSTIRIDFPPQRLAHGQLVTMTTRATIPDPALWAPGSPNLYDLDISIGDESSYYARVGLRQLTWGDGRLYLNGRRLQLHGASLEEDAPGHGDALTPADEDTIVSELKAIHANATRSQHPLDLGLLERLDAAGILVWQGVGPVDSSGNWTSTTPALMRLALRRVRISVRQAQLHPSIIAWNLANEIAANGHPGGQAQYIERSTAWLHAYDPSRLVAVDVWGEYPPTVAGPLYRNLDAVSLTDYAGWYDDPLGSTASVRSLINGRLDGLASVLPGKVLLVSEFGAEGNASNPDPTLGSYARQSTVLAENISAYEADPALSGMLVWNLRDFAVAPTFSGGRINEYDPGIRLVKGIDQKGLYGYDLRPKPAAGVVAHAYAALGPF